MHPGRVPPTSPAERTPGQAPLLICSPELPRKGTGFDLLKIDRFDSVCSSASHFNQQSLIRFETNSANVSSSSFFFSLQSHCNEEAEAAHPGPWSDPVESPVRRVPLESYTDPGCAQRKEGRCLEELSWGVAGLTSGCQEDTVSMAAQDTWLGQYRFDVPGTGSSQPGFPSAHAAALGPLQRPLPPVSWGGGWRSSAYHPSCRAGSKAPWDQTSAVSGCILF